MTDAAIELDESELIPDPAVAKMFNVTTMTLFRWSNDPKLGFPPPVKINTRNYRSAKALHDWKLRRIREANKGARK